MPAIGMLLYEIWSRTASFMSHADFKLEMCHIVCNYGVLDMYKATPTCRKRILLSANLCGTMQHR